MTLGALFNNGTGRAGPAVPLLLTGPEPVAAIWALRFVFFGAVEMTHFCVHL